MSSLQKPVLILNKHWKAVRIETVRDAITKVFCENAKILHEYVLYNIEEWLEFEVKDDEKYIMANHQKKVKLPKIVVLSEYEKIPKMEVKLTRKNVMIRDGFICQYTGVKLKASFATIDHVVPKSRGGKNVWENVVTSHPDVNRRKSDKTPDEAGLKLFRDPFRPSWSPLFASVVRNPPEDWKAFLTTKEQERFANVWSNEYDSKED